MIWGLFSGGLLAWGGLQVWTQSLAYRHAYSPALGRPLWTLKPLGRLWHQHNLYAPWGCLVWQWQWGTRGMRLALIGGALVVGLVGAGAVWVSRWWARRQPPAMTGHGTSRWAKTRDIKKAELL